MKLILHIWGKQDDWWVRSGPYGVWAIVAKSEKLSSFGPHTCFWAFSLSSISSLLLFQLEDHNIFFTLLFSSCLQIDMSIIETNNIILLIESGRDTRRKKRLIPEFFSYRKVSYTNRLKKYGIFENNISIPLNGIAGV